MIMEKKNTHPPFTLAFWFWKVLANVLWLYVPTVALSSKTHVPSESAFASASRGGGSNRRVDKKRQQIKAIDLLPQFAEDYSELVMAAVVERNFDNSELYLVLLLMGHKAFHDMPQRPFLMINSSLVAPEDGDEGEGGGGYNSDFLGIHHVDAWRRAAMIWDPSRRVNLNNSKMLCRLKNNIEDVGINKPSEDHNPASSPASSPSYLSKAHWLPGYLTADPGFNRNVDILRCKLQRGSLVYQALLLDKKAFDRRLLSVELLREETSSLSSTDLSPNSSSTVKRRLLSFVVPWRTRSTGYGFCIFKKNSRWDAWGFPSSYSRPPQPQPHDGTDQAHDGTDQPHDGTDQHTIASASSSKTVIETSDVAAVIDSDSRADNADQYKGTVYACLSTLRPLEPYRMDTGLPMLLENIEHNLLLGFDHIFVSLYLDDGPYSIHMQRYRLALDGYIRSGLVSIVSMAAHMSGFDDVSGFFGAQLVDDYARWLNQMQCLYLSKVRTFRGEHL